MLGMGDGWAHVQVLQARCGTDRPPLLRCDGLGRARALGIGADQRPAKGATGGGSGRVCVLGLSRLGGLLKTRCQGRGLCGDIRGGWRVLKRGGNSRGRISGAGRRNWRWGGGVPSGGLSGSASGELEKNGRRWDRREGVSRGRKLMLRAERGCWNWVGYCWGERVLRVRDWTLETGSTVGSGPLELGKVCCKREEGLE